MVSVCQPVDGTDQQLEPEAAVVKKERLEEATVCCVLEDHETAANSSSMYEQLQTQTCCSLYV